MKSHHFYFFFSVIFLLGLQQDFNALLAQENQPINLEEVLRLSDAQSLTLAEYRVQQEIAEAESAKAKEWWLPDLYGGVQTHQLWGAAMNTDGKFALDNARNNLWLGLGLDFNWDFADGIYSSKATQLEAKTIQYESEVERNKAILAAIESYYEFLSAQMQMKSFQELASQSDLLAQQMEVQVNAGLGYQSDLLLAKSNLNRIKVKALEARTKWSDQSSILLQLLNYEDAVQLIATDTLLVPLELIENSELLDFEDYFVMRPELDLLEAQKRVIAKRKKTTTVGLLLPELRVNAYLSYFGDLNASVAPLQPLQYPDPSQLYATQAVNASLLWRIPLGRLIYKGDLKKFDSQLLLLENKVKQAQVNIRSEIVAARKAMDNAKLQIELAEESADFARQALEQSIAREKLGVIRPYEILQAQEVYIQTRMDYIRAVSNHNIASYRLYVAMGNDL